MIAESDATRVVEGNHYFPPSAVDRRYLAPSELHTTCFWKGVCSYYHVVVDGEVNDNAAWFYPSTTAKAKPIEGYVAFWRGVEVRE